MADDDPNLFDDIMQVMEVEPPPQPPLPIDALAPDRTLGRFALDAALDRPTRRRIAAGGTLALVVEVPDSTWVEPIRLAVMALAAWDHVVDRSGRDRHSDKPTVGNAAVMAALGRGGRVAGIAPDPARHLPSALTAAADLRVVVSRPGPAVLRRAIRAATGKPPGKLPATVGLGLDYPAVCASIRVGTSPRACIRRLEAAARAQTLVDASLADVPELDQLSGYGEAMVWAKNLVDDLEAWRRGEVSFESLDRFAVLVSPPGLGKTSLVRSLARTSGLPLVPTSVSGWFAQSPGFLDSVIKQVDAVFLAADAAAAAGPGAAILLLDELDGLPNRERLSDRARDWWTPLVGHCLLKLDSAISGATSRLIVIGATNHHDQLDPAIIRPGRLSKVITIHPPDAADLARIVRHHLGPELEGEDLLPLASAAAGATGADVMGWVKGARRRARVARRAMELSDLVAEALPDDDRTSEEVRRAAIHESAHACLAWATGAGTVHSISIIGRRGSGGHCITQAGATLSRADLEAQVVTALAGRAGEQVLCGAVSSGAGGSRTSDLAAATMLLVGAHGAWGLGDSLLYRGGPDAAQALLLADLGLRQQVEEDLQRLHTRAVQLVAEHQVLIEAVAGVLLASKTISGPDFARLAAVYDRARADIGPEADGGQDG